MDVDDVNGDADDDDDDDELEDEEIKEDGKVVCAGSFVGTEEKSASTLTM